MDKYFALLIGAYGLIYADLDSQSFWNGFVLPAAFVISLAYLFWFKGFLILCVAAATFYYIDFGSESLFFALLLPFFFGANVVYFAYWGVIHYGIELGDFAGGDGGGDCG